ncbi:lytic murein transglycosylase [Massilia sp. WF1]|uniref:transglycosylase SLT domain-containing protein n=1 Tax=unclassified Massilia TaxID=2609279 RepID=UPI00064B78EB|nr:MULTISPECIES: transglycosylase SLT domain-containing protein [unclassified Massilia]ALK96656.1 lytic transglycosylase [Massilia sp. WG5]KLU38275.1 lytic murein transglycosylase [Massilia sp. WF1]
MYETTRTTQALALAILLAPAISHAADSAPSTITQSAPGINAMAAVKPAQPASLTALKADDYKDPDLWGRIRSGYAIPDVDNALVAKHIQWYASRPDYLARTSGRASLYLYHVVQELEKRGMPTELALLPVIESAFNPQALSTADASGLWQFVPGTGRDFNLKQNMFKDERRGVLASTDAALTYLQRLYTMFGDWQLALAAYNWGEGNVQKAIQKNRAAGKPTDFESLAELMPAETRNYVPKLQAVKNIIANPAQYGVTLPAIDNQPYFTTIDKTSDIDLAVAAQLAEMSVDEFKALNPQFKKPVIAGDSKILLPKENAEKFHLNLAQWGHALSSWTTHKITGAKESIASLASKFGTTPEVIRQANNIPPQMRLKAGSTILVPKTSASAGDITENIIDNAQIALEADRGESRHKGHKLSGVQRIKASAAHAVAEIKSRVSGGSKPSVRANGRKHR